MPEPDLHALARALGAALSATGQVQSRGLAGKPRAPSTQLTCEAQLRDALRVLGAELVAVAEGLQA